MWRFGVFRLRSALQRPPSMILFPVLLPSMAGVDPKRGSNLAFASEPHKTVGVFSPREVNGQSNMCLITN